MSDTPQKKGKKFEDIVGELYQQLTKNERIKATVETRVTLIGDDGASHEIDVLYSYEHFGVKYKVAIECKNWKNPINVAELRNFSYKLEHLGNINGIFISAESEFQDGAKKVSDYQGIKLIKYNEFNRFISGQNEDYLIPDYHTVGEPFWILMNSKGRNSVEQNLFLSEGLLLFESKYFAESFKKLRFGENAKEVKLVGVSQAHLKEIKELKKNDNIPVKMFNQFTTGLGKIPYHFWDLDIQDIDMYLW